MRMKEAEECLAKGLIPFVMVAQNFLVWASISSDFHIDTPYIFAISAARPLTNSRKR